MLNMLNEDNELNPLIWEPLFRGLVVGLGEWMNTLWVALKVGRASRALSHSAVQLCPFKKIVFKVIRRSSQNQSGQ